MLLSNLALLVLSSCIQLATARPALSSRNEGTTTCTPKPAPTHWGILMPRAFAPLDVFGPVEALQALARSTHLKLSLLARTMEPVSSAPVSPAMNRFNSSFWPSFVPTDTYADNPPIQVLLIPGGAAARSPDLGPELEYIRKVTPSLQYLITICTGAGIAAQAGVLDGHRATTNKRAWNEMIPRGTNVKWVSPARWVEDGKVWSSSGVTSGIDLTLAFIEAKYPNGSTLANDISHTMEHQRITDWRHDPEAEYFHVPPTN